MKSRDYKRQAKASLKGNWGAAVFATFVVFVISAICATPNTYYGLKSGAAQAVTLDLTRMLFGIMSATLLLEIFLLYPLEVGFANAFKKLHVEGDAELAENTFRLGFKNYSHIVLGILHMAVLTLLWTLLLIIPGIIKSFSYAMTPFILVDRPELSTREAIHESRRMMKGRKWDLFCLVLSFIGWIILGIFTLFIGYLWLVPYMQTSFAAFYQNILEEEKAEMAASFSTAAPKQEPVKVREFEPSNHDDYAPKEDWTV